jgi:hypothetical protein
MIEAARAGAETPPLHQDGRKTWQVDCNVARADGRLRMDQACLTIIFQRSRMDRED